MKHSEKRHLAFKLRTPAETQRTDKLAHEGLFGSKAWEARRTGIAARVKRHQAEAHASALARAAGPKTSVLTRARQAIQRARDRRAEARRRRNAAYLLKHSTA